MAQLRPHISKVIKNKKFHYHLTFYSSNTPAFFKGRGLTLPKIPGKGGWKDCWWVGETLRKRGEDSVGKERDAVSLGISSGWGVANVTTVTFNYILVKLSLFPLNLDVTPCFHETVLAPVYRVNTSCIPNTVVSSNYRLHTFCLHPAGVTPFSV